jgi:hypothetical protein
MLGREVETGFEIGHRFEVKPTALYSTTRRCLVERQIVVGDFFEYINSGIWLGVRRVPTPSIPSKSYDPKS